MRQTTGDKIGDLALKEMAGLRSEQRCFYMQ
jgi:hypothetical protein